MPVAKTPSRTAGIKLTLTVVMYAVKLLAGTIGCASLAAAGCVEDNYWTVKLFSGPEVFWAQVPYNGQFTHLWESQCKVEANNTCTPCKNIIVDKVQTPMKMSPCSMVSPVFGKRDVEGESETLVGLEARDDVQMAETIVSPPKHISAMQCKLSLG